MMDEARLNDFMGKLVNDMGGAAMLANVILGEELGLYRAMADSQPVTPKHSPRRPAATPACCVNGSAPTPPPVTWNTATASSACPKSKPWRWRSKIHRSMWPAVSAWLRRFP